MQQPLHCLQCVEEVVGLSTLEQRTCLPRASRSRKRLSSPCPGVSSSPPTPPQEKNHPQPTQKRLPIKTSPSPVPDQGADSLGIPHLRINYADLTEVSSPGRISDHVLASSRPRFSNPSCHHAGTTTKRSPHQTQPDVCPRNGPGLPAHPSQSGGQPTHLPHLPRTGVKKPTRRQDSQRP